MLLELSRTFLAWVLILPLSFLIGSAFRPLVREQDVVLRGILYSALGLACFSYSVILLSTFHWLKPSILWALLVLLGVLRYRGFREWRTWVRTIGSRFSFRGTSGLFRILLALFFLSFVALLLGTLSPEIGGDALCYQLNLPKVFLHQGSLRPSEYDYNSYFPLLMNNLYLIGLATGGVFAAKLFHFFFGFFLFLSIREVIYSETSNDSLSLFIALALWVTPVVYNLLSTAYVDVALAFYTFLSLYVFLQGEETQDRRLFLLSGFLVGCAVSIKYLGLIAALGLVAVWTKGVIKGKGSGFSQRVVNLFFWTGGVILVSGYWLFRNWTVTGNPFFPYFGSLFHLYHRPPVPFAHYGYGRDGFQLVSVFWNMFYSPADFGTFPTRIGIFYFLYFPFVFLAWFFSPRSRGYVLFTLSFLLSWFFMAQAARWFLAALPAMSVAAAFGMQGLYAFASSQMKSVLKWAGGVVGMVGVTTYVLAGVFHYRYTYFLYLGQWSFEEYLAKMERTFPLTVWTNQNLRPDAKILLESETRQFYFNHPTVRDVYLKWRLRYEESGWMVEDLVRFIRSQGITHLLINDPIPVVDSERKSLLRALAKSRFVSKVKQISSENIRDEKYLYTLYEIKPV